MAETAANLIEHVLPTQVPLRQFVLTLPFELRARLAYDGALLGAVCHAFVDSTERSNAGRRQQVCTRRADAACPRCRYRKQIPS